jgi:DNA processing protein
MTRNNVIIGLSMAVVVVEAGETGGTLAAGTQALRLGRRVLALEFSSTPVGNKRLLSDGAVSVRGRTELNEFMNDLVHVTSESEDVVLAIDSQYALSVERPTDRT